MLQAWDYDVRADSVAPTIFNVFFTQWCRAVAVQRFDGPAIEVMAPALSGCAGRLLEGDPLGWFGGGGLQGTADFFANGLGLEPGLFFAALVGATEFFGGLLLAVGLFTRPAAVAAAVLLFVAAFKVHLASGFFVMNGGYEYALLWGLICLAIAFRGGGELSVDRAVGREF